jgi:hypothetical protein
MSYVVRDHRSTGRWLAGLALSVGVVVSVCVASGRWWVAAVGLPPALVVAGWRARDETTPLRTDAAGITLAGRWVGWQDVDEVLVGSAAVEVTLGDRAPLPPWATARVTGGRTDSRLRLTATVHADPGVVLAGIRSQAPHSVPVRRG